MGKTAMSGPVYGAKSLLFSVHYDNTVVGGLNRSIIVPDGENWIITDVHAYKGSTHSTFFVATVTDDSTVIATCRITSSLAEKAGSTRIAPVGGEYTGIEVATGSSLTVNIDNSGSSAAASSKVSVWVYGFQRWLMSSTLGQGPGS